MMLIYAEDEICLGYYVMHDMKTLPERVYLRLRAPRRASDYSNIESEPCFMRGYRMQAEFTKRDVARLTPVLTLLMQPQNSKQAIRTAQFARELKKAERLLRRPPSTMYYGAYSTSRQKHKILYDVYQGFMRDLATPKHEKLRAKANVRAELLR